MTQKQAIAKILKHVKDHGGNPDHISWKSTRCKPWKWEKPKTWAEKRCSHHMHAFDCPTGKRYVRIECFRPVRGLERLGLPGFIEIVAEAETWEEAVDKCLSRKLWITSGGER